jgi:alpha-beta hydrolase superfamily lysophospholipase
VALYQHRWVPQSPITASVIIVHGYGEHGARYEALARPLNEQGVAVYTCDLPGHGRSPGARGIINRFDDMVDGLAAYVDGIEFDAPSAPRFLFGHSFGALLLGHYVLKQRPRVHGLIFSSGALKVGADISPALQRLSWVLNTFAPWVPAVTIRPELTSRIPASVERYATDPLVLHRPMRAGTGYQILLATRAFQDACATIADPVLIVHGTADRLTDPEGSRQFHDRAASTDKTLVFFDGAYHEMLHDLNAGEFINTIQEWISKRIY